MGKKFVYSFNEGSKDMKDFQHYYLDKIVCLNAGTYFCLSPLRKEASKPVTARMASAASRKKA